jgi:hypothetical protein
MKLNNENIKMFGFRPKKAGNTIYEYELKQPNLTLHLFVLRSNIGPTTYRLGSHFTVTTTAELTAAIYHLGHAHGTAKKLAEFRELGNKLRDILGWRNDT